MLDKFKIFSNSYIMLSAIFFQFGILFSPEIFEGVVAFSDVVKLGSITNVTQSAT